MIDIGDTTIVKCTVFGILGGVLSAIANLFGGWSSDLQVLIIFMIIDFIMGLTLAAVFKNSSKTKTGALESSVGWKGLCKKCFTLLFVLIAHQLDLSMGLNYIRTATIIGFIANESVSIVENAGLMGLPLPNVIKKSIDILKNKYESEGRKK